MSTTNPSAWFTVRWSEEGVQLLDQRELPGQEIYLTLTSVVVGVLLAVGMIGVIVVLLAEAHEWAEALWIKEHRRLFKPMQVADETLPVVSVHVPAYNEPPEMMIETLDALAALDYPRFEVVVIDNNTRDPSVWQPVREHCQRLGPRFRFFHQDPLAGFKAGALANGLKRTDKKYVAIFDADFNVFSAINDVND